MKESGHIESGGKSQRKLRGCEKKKIPKIRDYYRSLTRILFCFENHPETALNQYRHFGVVYHMYSVCIYIVKSA